MLHNTELPPLIYYSSVLTSKCLPQHSCYKCISSKWWRYYVIVHNYSTDGREEKGVNRNKLHLFGHNAVYCLSWHTMASKSGNGIHLAQMSAHVWCYCLLAVWTYAIAVSETLHILLPKTATEENKIEAFAVTDCCCWFWCNSSSHLQTVLIMCCLNKECFTLKPTNISHHTPVLLCWWTSDL